MQPCSKRRLQKLGILLLGGLCYALLCIARGAPLLACPFYWATGRYCPGCGVSRMLLALLRLDFAAAWRSNPLLLCLSPLAGWIACSAAVSYVKKGRVSLKKAQERMLWLAAVLLLMFGAVRNIPGFEVLQPH